MAAAVARIQQTCLDANFPTVTRFAEAMTAAAASKPGPTTTISTGTTPPSTAHPLTASTTSMDITANNIAFLFSDESAHIAGQVINISGGWYLTP